MVSLLTISFARTRLMGRFCDVANINISSTDSNLPFYKLIDILSMRGGIAVTIHL